MKRSYITAILLTFLYISTISAQEAIACNSAEFDHLVTISETSNSYFSITQDQNAQLNDMRLKFVLEELKLDAESTKTFTSQYKAYLQKMSQINQKYKKEKVSLDDAALKTLKINTKVERQTAKDKLEDNLSKFMDSAKLYELRKAEDKFEKMLLDERQKRDHQ